MDETRERKGDSLLAVGARMFTLESNGLGSNLNTHKGVDMRIFIWHRVWPCYDQRMKLMNNPVNVQMSIDEANQLTLVPKE